MKARTKLRTCARLCAFLGWLWLSATAPGEVVIQRWAVGERASHPGSVKILDAGAGAAVIQIDLAALARGRQKIYQARLLASRQEVTGADDEAMVKVEIYPLRKPFRSGQTLPPGKEPLKLIAPWYHSFDATEAVASAVARRSDCQLYVKVFPKWQKETTELEVVYEGKLPSQLPPAVKDLKVLHRAGQTFITFKEIEDPFGDRPATMAELESARTEQEGKRRIRYRIHRHGKPISRKSLAETELLAEVEPFSGFNVRGVCLNRLIHQHQLRAVADGLFARKIAGGPFRGYSRSMPEMGEVVVGRLAVEDGKPLPPGPGLYVHHPAAAGQAYYAVLATVDGTANTKDFAATAKPASEQAGWGKPVFQCVEDLRAFYDYPGQRRRYVQWCAPPLANLPNQYHNWGVYLPPGALGGSEGRDPARGAQAPAALALGIFFHDGQAMYLKPRWPHPKDMILIAPHDGPRPSFGYGYHESLGTLRPFSDGVVQDYTARRIDAFVEWLCGAFRVDRNRMSCHGSGAYGGTSAIAYALRHPERFSLIVAGNFDADPKSVQKVIQIDRNRRRSHLPALEAVWGKKEWDLKTATGQSIWQDRDMVALVGRSPALALPFMSLGTGSQHSTWPQENALLEALMAARQPFRTDFTWGGQAPHFGPMHVRRDKLMLAGVPTQEELKKSSWYNDAHWQQAATGYWGGGHAMINMGLTWQVDDIVDAPDRLEVSGYAGGEVTLRNTQAFKLKPGEKARWQLQTGRHGKQPSGEAAADEHGLLTVPGFRGRLIVTRITGEKTEQERTGK